METPAQAGAAMFEDAIAWLRDTYDDSPYFAERDLVYAVQLRLWRQVRERGLDWFIFNDYPMLPGFEAIAQRRRCRLRPRW